MVTNDRLQDVLSRLDGVRGTGSGFEARCPAHDDQHASLSVNPRDDGGVLLHCHAGCSAIAVCQAIGLKLSALFPRNPKSDGRIVATYDYVDADGGVLYQAVRFEPKDFCQRRPDGKGGWIWDLANIPRVLYRLPELLVASPDEWVFIVEGEKDADRLASVGLIATCNSGGAGKWAKLSDDSVLHGRRVAIIADKDRAGRKHAADVVMRLRDRAREVRVLDLPGKGNDASDWFDAGGTTEELLGLVESARDTPLPDSSPSDPQSGEIDPVSERLILSTQRTLPTAETYVEQFHCHSEGVTLRHYAGMFLKWHENRYAEIENAALRNQLLPWMHAAVHMVLDRKSGEWMARDFPANRRNVNAALDAVADSTFLDAATASPAWLDNHSGRPEPGEILPCKSGLLHIPTMAVLPPTPAFFSVSALDYDHASTAPDPPQWLQFLGQLFEDDLTSWDLLQDWFGYCLTGDTSQHKMLLIVGPRRSGKGTLARVLAHLVGPANVCGPTTSGLAGQFGLQPLIGKSLAVVSDARFLGKDIQTVVERLLCVSGEDALTIERKHASSVTMKLPTRFVFLTNELPRLSDTSGALAGRFMVLRLTESFYGREDKTLTATLLTELPGILNWAIDGWRQLRERGHFVQPSNSEDAISTMEDLSSPVGAFVRDRCEVGGDLRSWCDETYQAWKSWCEADGRIQTTTKQTFGRDLRAAVPGLACRQGTNGVRFYHGVELKSSTPA